jgi:hypothetical protein
MVSEPTINQQPRDRDIFEGPDDLVTPNDPLIHQILTQRQEESIRGSDKDALDESAEHDKAPTAIRAAAKRRREEDTWPTSRDEGQINLSSSNKKKKYHLADSPRRTDRKRTQRSIPGAIRDDQVEEILKEQENIEILESEQLDHFARLHEKERALRKRPSGGLESVPKTPPIQTSPPGKTFSAPTAPMTASKKGKSPISLPKTSRTVQRNSSPSKVRGKTQNNEVDRHHGLQPAEPRSTSEFMSKFHSTSSAGDPSSGMGEKEVISLTQDEDVPVSKSPLLQRNETSNDQPPFSAPMKATTADPRPALPRQATYGASADSIQGGNEDDDINFQRTILDSIAQAQAPARVEVKSSAELPGRQDMEHQAKYVGTLAAEHSGSRTHTEITMPKLSTENIDIKPPSNPTLQPTPEVLAQPQLPAQPIVNPQPPPIDPSSSKPRPKTQIPLWIITREPRYTEERWDDGKFSGTPLSAFIAGISQVTQRQHIEKVKLTLRTPMSDTKITVFKDAEDSWTSAKDTFVEKLKEARLEARARRQNDSLSCKILVEPFYEQNMLPSGSFDEDDEEFEF